MHRRRVLAGLVGIATGLDLPPIVRASAAQPVVLSGTVSLSGPLADFGHPVQRALRLWAEEAGAGAAFGGSTVEVNLEDDESSPDIARRHFERLAPTSDLLIAPYGSRLTEAVLPIVERAGRPCLASSAGDAGLWKTGRAWLAQLLNPSETMLNSMLDAASAAGARSVAFVLRHDPFSKLVFGGAFRHAQELGWDVRAFLPYENEAEARAAAREVAALPRPDLVVGMGFRPGGAGSGFLEDALLLLDVMTEAGVDPKALSLGIGAADPDFVEAVGRRAERIVGTTGWRSYLATPGNRRFIEAYRRRWGEVPDIHAAQAYAAGEVFTEAWRRAAGRSGERPAPETVRDALFALDLETVFGRFRVNDRGLQVGKENAVVQWQNGEPRVVWPQRYATDALRLTG